MRIAFSNIAWAVEEQEAVAGAMAGEGVGGVEIAPTTLWPDPAAVTAAQAGEQRSWWDRRGIEIVAMQALLYGRPDLTIFESAERRGETLEYLSAIFRLAAWLGARRLVFGSPRNRQAGALPRAERDEIAREFFANAGGVASSYDVMLCIEPNPPAYGCDFVTRVEEARSLVAEVDSPGFGLHLDTGGMTLQGERADVVAEGAPDHFHVSEPHLAPVGGGDTDHAGYAKALRRTGYGGWCSVEMRKPEDASRIEELIRVMRFAITEYGSR